MFTDSAGTCCNCGDKTSSAALKLCGRCSAALHRCERCMAPLDANAGPLPSTNPSLNWRHSSDLADTAPSTPTPTPNYTPTPTPNQLGSPARLQQRPRQPQSARSSRSTRTNRGCTWKASGSSSWTLPVRARATRPAWGGCFTMAKSRRAARSTILPHALGTHLLGWRPATLSGLHGWMPFRSRQVNRTGENWP